MHSVDLGDAAGRRLLSTGFYSARGAGLVFILGTKTLRQQRGWGVLLVLAGMALHGLWDCMAALSIVVGMNSMLLLLLTTGLEVVVAVTVFKRLAVGERSWMRDLMAPEVRRGTITDEELAALSGSRKARKAYVKAAKGRTNHGVARNVIEAATDLAEQIAIAEGDGDRRRRVRSFRGGQSAGCVGVSTSRKQPSAKAASSVLLGYIVVRRRDESDLRSGLQLRRSRLIGQPQRADGSCRRGRCQHLPRGIATLYWWWRPALFEPRDRPSLPKWLWVIPIVDIAGFMSDIARSEHRGATSPTSTGGT